MNNDFFKKIRILDGGTGQELLARGMDPRRISYGVQMLYYKKNIIRLLLDTTFRFCKIRC